MITGPVEVEFNSDIHEGKVEEDYAIAFARATNDGNEGDLAGEVVPPMFTAALILGAFSQSQLRGRTLGLVRGGSGSVHGQHDVRYPGVVEPGQELRWQATLYAAKQTKAGPLVTQRILVTDARGVPVVDHFWSNVHLGGTLETALGPDLDDHTFPEECRDRPLATCVLPVDLDQAYRYAGVSGDHAPHAMEDANAQREGFPSKILQGMCTFSMCSAALVGIGAGGDTALLRRFAGRFARPAFPKRDLVIHAFDAGTTREGHRAVAFEVIQEGAVVIKHGRAEFSRSPNSQSPNSASPNFKG